MRKILNITLAVFVFLTAAAIMLCVYIDRNILECTDDLHNTANQICFNDVLLEDYSLDEILSAGVSFNFQEHEDMVLDGVASEINSIPCTFTSGDNFTLSLYKKAKGENAQYRIKYLDLRAENLKFTNIIINNVHIGEGQAIDILDNFPDNFTVVESSKDSNDKPHSLVSCQFNEYTIYFYLNDGIVYRAEIFNDFVLPAVNSFKHTLLIKENGDTGKYKRYFFNDAELLKIVYNSDGTIKHIGIEDNSCWVYNINSDYTMSLVSKNTIVDEFFNDYENSYFVYYSDILTEFTDNEINLENFNGFIPSPDII